MAKKKNKDNTGVVVLAGLGLLFLLGSNKNSGTGGGAAPTGTTGGSSGTGGIISKYYTIDDVQRSQLGKENNISEQFGALTTIQKRDINDFIRIVLDPLTQALGSKLTINSWWRSKIVNDLADGEADSLHLKGGAIDFFFNSGNIIDNAKVIKALYTAQLPFTELILYGSKTSPKSLHLAFDYLNPIEKEILFKKSDGSYERLSNEFIYNNFIA